MVTMAESFICPNCKETHTSLTGSSALLSNVRVDFFGCPVCGTTWRVYSTVSESTIEVTGVGETPVDTTPEETLEVPDTSTNE